MTFPFLSPGQQHIVFDSILQKVLPTELSHVPTAYSDISCSFSLRIPSHCTTHRRRVRKRSGTFRYHHQRHLHALLHCSFLLKTAVNRVTCPLKEDESPPERGIPPSHEPLSTFCSDIPYHRLVHVT